MSSLIYRQHYSNGTSDLRRRTKPQGRPQQGDDLKMIRVNVTMSPNGKKAIQARAKEMNMSFSAYLDLAGILYTPESVKL